MTRTKNLKDILSLGASNIIYSIIYGLFWLFLATLLTKVEYGELGFLMSLANVGSVVALLGLTTTVLVYESKNENVFPSSFILVLIASAITGAVSYVLIQNVVASFLIVGITIFAMVLSGLNGKQRHRDYSIHTLIRAPATVALAIILYNFFGINGILFGYLVTSLFVLKELPSLLKNMKVNFSVLRPKVGFMVHSWSTRLAQILFWWGDKLLIGSLFGFSMLASYQFAAQYLLLLETFPRSLSQYLVPQESMGKKNKKLKIYSSMLASLIALGSIAAIPYGINILLPEYYDSILPAQIMSIAIIPLSISMIQQSEFLGKEKSSIVLMGSVLQTGVYFLLITWLGQSFGLMGIAIGFLTAAILRTVFNLFTGLHMLQQE